MQQRAMPRHLVLTLAAIFLFAFNVDLSAQGGDRSGSSAPVRRTTALPSADKPIIDPALITAAAQTAKVSPKSISDSDAAGKKLTLTPAQAVSSRLRSLAAGRYLGTLETQLPGPNTKLPAGKYNLFLVQQSDQWHLYFESGGNIVGEASHVTVRKLDPKNRADLARDSVNPATGAVTLRSERPLSKRGKPLRSPQEAVQSLHLRQDSTANATAELEGSLEHFISQAGRLLKGDAAKDIEPMEAQIKELQAQKKKLKDLLKKQMDAQARYEQLRSRLRGKLQQLEREGPKKLAAEIQTVAAEVLEAVNALKKAASKARADTKAALTDATRWASGKADEATRAAADAAKKAADKVSATAQQAIDAASQAAEESAEAAAQAADDAADTAQGAAESVTDTATDLAEAIISFLF